MKKKNYIRLIMGLILIAILVIGFILMPWNI